MFFYRELSEQAAAAVTDPYFANVSLLLRGEGTGIARVLDESNNEFTLEVFGDTVLSPTVKKYGSYSMKFDGNGDYLSIPQNTAFNFGTGDFTVESWVYLNAAAGTQTIFGSSGNGGLMFGFVNGTQIGWAVPGRRGAISWVYAVESGVSLNTWYHIAFTRQGTDMKIFIDGSQVGTTQTNASSYDMSLSFFGVGGTYTYFNGYLDDLRITKGVARYTANFTPPAAELPASTAADPYFNNVSLLLRGAGSLIENSNVPRTILDQSVNNTTVTLFGDTYLTTAIKKYGTYGIKFDGTGDYLGIPYNTNLNLDGDFTIETWINPSNLNGFTLIGQPAAGGNGGLTVSIGAASSNLQALNIGRANISTDFYFYIPQFIPNTWHHLAITRSGSAVRLFMNGIQVGDTKNTNANGELATFSLPISPAGMYICANEGGSANLTGYLDDFRITKGVARYTANFTPPTEELPAS